MDQEQEKICRAIDQRARDQATVRWFELQHETPQTFWTGYMRVNNRVLRKAYFADWPEPK